MTTMFCFAEMLLPHIKDSKISLPEDLNVYSRRRYPHWHIFKATHLGVAIDPSTLAGNADIVAKLTDEEVKTVTIEDLIAKGMHVSNSTRLD
jgi:hypothetical protein